MLAHCWSAVYKHFIVIDADLHWFDALFGTYYFRFSPDRHCYRRIDGFYSDFLLDGGDVLLHHEFIMLHAHWL